LPKLASIRGYLDAVQEDAAGKRVDDWEEGAGVLLALLD
jgi:hypothetical protein